MQKTHGHVELQVSTWLAVLAEMARSRIKSPDLTDRDFLGQIMREMSRMDPPLGTPDPRRALLRMAALSMRMLDERYPGDGIDFEALDL